jgi:Tol biopolymer transport system component
MGLVTGLGCGARALDSMGTPVSGTDGSPAMPAQDGGPVTTGLPGGVDAWIAFDSDGGTSNRDIYVIRPDGTGRRRLTTEPSTEEQPSFSPDGTKLAFASDREGGVLQIYVMDLATGVSTRVTQRAEGAHDPAFTIEGTRLAYRSGVLVFSAMLDGSDERQATDGTTCCASGPFGGPAFPYKDDRMFYDDYNAIYVLGGVSTTRGTVVMPTTGEQSHPAVSPDGSTLVFQATCDSDAPRRSIWAVSTTQAANLACHGRRLSDGATDATHASWGPSDIVVWGSVTGGNNHSSPVPSSLVTSQDGTVRTLTSGEGDDRNPSWSTPGIVIGAW